MRFRGKDPNWRVDICGSYGYLLTTSVGKMQVAVANGCIEEPPMITRDMTFLMTEPLDRFGRVPITPKTGTLWGVAHRPPHAFDRWEPFHLWKVEGKVDLSL